MEEHATPCPRCRHGNPPENRFCGACGVSLTAGEGLAHRPESVPAENRPLLPVELKPVGRALAVGLAALAAEAGLAWLRRRTEVPGRASSLPVVRETEPAIREEHPVYQSFEEVYTWLREGNFERQTVAQRTLKVFRNTNPTDGQRRGF